MKSLLVILLFFSCFGSYGTDLKEDFDGFESAIKNAQAELYDELEVEFIELIRNKLSRESVFQKTAFARFKRSVSKKINNLTEENGRLRSGIEECNQEPGDNQGGGFAGGYIPPAPADNQGGGSADYIPPAPAVDSQGGGNSATMMELPSPESPEYQGSSIEGIFNDFIKDLDYQLKVRVYELAKQFKPLIQLQLRKQLAQDVNLANFQKGITDVVSYLKRENEKLKEQLKQCNQGN